MKPRKECECPGCKRPAFGGGYCDWPAHQNMRTDAGFLRRKAEREAKPVKVYQIPKVSKKYAKELRIYAARTPSWKEENHWCAYPGCKRQVQDRHHVIGRGMHLNDESENKPLCDEHHALCKSQPKLAMELGLIKSRVLSRKYKKWNSS